MCVLFHACHTHTHIYTQPVAHSLVLFVFSTLTKMQHYIAWLKFVHQKHFCVQTNFVRSLVHVCRRCFIKQFIDWNLYLSSQISHFTSIMFSVIYRAIAAKGDRMNERNIRIQLIEYNRLFYIMYRDKQSFIRIEYCFFLIFFWFFSASFF